MLDILTFYCYIFITTFSLPKPHITGSQKIPKTEGVQGAYSGQSLLSEIASNSMRHNTLQLHCAPLGQLCGCFIPENTGTHLMSGVDLFRNSKVQTCMGHLLLPNVPKA